MSLRRSEEDLTVCQTESNDHTFHKTCLNASLNNSQHCPNCQTNLPIEDIFGQILTRQQTRLLESNKTVMANTPEPTDRSQTLSPELTRQISEMVLSTVQAQQSTFLESLSVTMIEMVQNNIEEGLTKVNLPTSSTVPNQAQSQSYFNLDFNRTGSISQQPLDHLLGLNGTNLEDHQKE
uniref:Uncharacterized protein n=1 Tax=Glossina palpalis gambiensis TaxID=67801 RepID=A0A1B0BP81_9MUSC